eukprot:gene11644-15594_t
MLTDEDYAYEVKLRFDPKGSSGPPFPTPPHKLSFAFKFKDYMTNVFRAVRELSFIDEADYMVSLAGDFNYIEFIANSKSGQFFFYSHDGKYMIKTQTKQESKLLRKIMRQYVEHLSNNPNSLLVRFYGMHRVRMKKLQRDIYFVIMSSVFDTDKPIHHKYDLKGSLVGRLTNEEDCLAGAVQKDINLTRSGKKLRLDQNKYSILTETLRNDVNFLKSLNIMDYSLLVGIHNSSEKKSPARRSSIELSSKSFMMDRGSQDNGVGGISRNNHNSSAFIPGYRGSADDTLNGLDMPIIPNECSAFRADHGGMKSCERSLQNHDHSDGGEIYYLGIIDILQLYSTSKQVESITKGFRHSRSELSSVPPSQYANRLHAFVMSHVELIQNNNNNNNNSDINNTSKNNSNHNTNNSSSRNNNSNNNNNNNNNNKL